MRLSATWNQRRIPSTGSPRLFKTSSTRSLLRGDPILQPPSKRTQQCNWYEQIGAQPAIRLGPPTASLRAAIGGRSIVALCRSSDDGAELSSETDNPESGHRRCCRSAGAALL